MGDPVKFIYVQSGRPLPEPLDSDGIYFVEDAKQVWARGHLIAEGRPVWEVIAMINNENEQIGG